MMADSKLEEVIDLLAKYGGFNREYLRDKLLTFANDGRSETKNKMEAVAALFNKKLGEVFSVEYVTGRLGRNRNFASCCYFKNDGLFCEDRGPCEIMLNDLLTGKAVIINE